MTMNQIDQLEIVRTNLALLSAIRITELPEEAQFGFDRMIHESLSIVSTIVDSRPTA